MQLFYLPELVSGEVDLPATEARHAVQVLRKQIGDTLDLVDGKGGWYKGQIIASSKRSCRIDVELVKQEERRANTKITVAISPTKTNERIEWFLEKATELGIDEIIPLRCHRTERPRIRLDRYEKVLVSAMKQSLQAWLPVLHPLSDFSTVIAGLPQQSQKFIGWCDDSVSQSMAQQYRSNQDVCVLIGPEGDFTKEEVEKALAAGCQPMTLGSNRLRTETAGISAVQTIHTVNALSE